MYYIIFLWDWGLNSGFQTFKEGALPLEPHLQSILLWLFWRWGFRSICSGWPWTVILLISAFQVARISGVRHQHPAYYKILNWNFKSYFVSSFQPLASGWRQQWEGAMVLAHLVFIYSCLPGLYLSMIIWSPHVTYGLYMSKYGKIRWGRGQFLLVWVALGSMALVIKLALLGGPNG
jgi:hypothetical protein